MATLAKHVTLDSPAGNARIDVPRLDSKVGQAALRREQQEAERTFRLALRLNAAVRDLRAAGQGDSAEALQGTLDEFLVSAPPVRIGLVARALDVSPKVVQRLAAAGILELVPARVARVTPSSVVRIWPLVARLRAQGRTRNLVGMLQSRLDNESTWSSADFKTGLDEMHRGERGEWPDDF